MCAAETFECAAFETVFHDVPARAKTRVVPIGSIAGRAYADLKVKRSLRPGALFAPDLKSFGLKRTQLIDVTAKWYVETARWAEAVHAQYKDLEGDFEVTTSPTSIAHSATLLSSLRTFSSRAGITIIR